MDGSRAYALSSSEGALSLSPSYSVRLGRERIDDENHFECRRCLRVTRACDGGSDDAYDPHGDLCSVCWCHVRDNADRYFSLLNERLVTPRRDTSGRWEFNWLKFEAPVTLTLEDGTAWSKQPGQRWICIRGPASSSFNDLSGNGNHLLFMNSGKIAEGGQP